MGSAVLFVAWPTLLAALTALASAAFAWRVRSKLERLSAPTPEQLLAELSSEAEPNSPPAVGARQAAIAELNQRIADVSFELGLLPATFTALIRINLASGTALSLFGFFQTDASMLPDRAVRGGLCAVSGLVGASVVAALGRKAKRRVVQIRQAWDRSSREVGKALGTHLV